MGASGYASTIAELTGEPVYFANFYRDDETNVRYKDGIMYVKDDSEEWIPIRAAFRYVTQRPWERIPMSGKTHIFNPIITCLAGGRNKMTAAKAYDLFNADLAETGLEIFTPQTIRDVGKQEIPLWVKKFGGQAVIKVPYSNAGQGVYTIVNEQELDNFMSNQDFDYELFIVQSLIGNYQWSSTSDKGKLYHVGTMPNKKGESYVCDIRMMVGSYARGNQANLCVFQKSVETFARYNFQQ